MRPALASAFCAIRCSPYSGATSDVMGSISVCMIRARPRCRRCASVIATGVAVPAARAAGPTRSNTARRHVRTGRPGARTSYSIHAAMTSGLAAAGAAPAAMAPPSPPIGFPLGARARRDPASGPPPMAPLAIVLSATVSAATHSRSCCAWVARPKRLCASACSSDGMFAGQICSASARPGMADGRTVCSSAGTSRRALPSSSSATRRTVSV